jgi:hypothetical protein
LRKKRAGSPRVGRWRRKPAIGMRTIIVVGGEQEEKKPLTEKVKEVVGVK